MTPILYEKDEIDFTSQGLGSLAEIYDADVAEQRNGLLQLTASYPVTGVRYDDISVGRIILAKPNQRDEPHAFRITSTDLDIMGHNVMIEADSITYDLNHNIVKHVSVNGQSGQAMMTALQMAVVNPSIFTFYSDITHVSSTSLDYVNPMEAVMGVKGSFLQIWGGELKRENRRVAMFNRRGRDNVATFRLGKNISGLKYKVDISSLVTRILPIKSVQENDTTTYLEGTPVSSQYINSYEQIYTIKVDFTDDKIKTVDDLNKASANWFVDSANTARDKPSVTIDIDVLSLQDSADYQDKFKDLESVALTDTVTVYVPEYGINVTAIVNEIHFDPIQERVTKLTVGTARMSFADSSRVQLSDLQDKVISVQEQADQIAVSANGKSTNYYGSVEPSHPQEGDTWFWVDGDKSGIKVFVNGDWVEPVDSDTQEKIEDAVTDAVTQAKAYSDQLVADNVAQVNRTLSDVQAKQADLTAQQAELDIKAQGYANKALADAKADTLATATQTAKDASDALATAKTDLTTSHNKEVTDRANAVTALDTKAKGYADTAKADAISASTTADGVINKKIDDTASSIASTISQNKTDADGKITTAQNTATQALNGLATKVSQTVYDTKTGQLQTDLNTTTTTANQAKTDIVAIKSDNTKQDARMTTIESDANGTKTTVSNLQTDLGKANGSITTLQQRADGFDATVATLGGVNQVINSELTPDFSGWLKDLDFTNNRDMSDVTGLSLDQYTYKQSNIIKVDTSKYNFNPIISMPVKITDQVGQISFSAYISTVTGYTGRVSARIKFYNANRVYISTSSGPTVTSNTGMTYVSETVNPPVGATYVAFAIGFDAKDGFVRMSKPMMSFSSKVMDYVQGNYNNNTSVAKAQLTADNASLALSNYQTDADGRISRAKADIIVNANAITQKVSQSDYNAKTGDLTTKVNTAQSTADSATSTIGSYKTANDARVASAEGKITANATAITQKVSQSDYNTKTGQIDAQISTINQTATGISQSVSNVKAQVDGLSVGGRNLFILSTASKGWLDMSYNVTAPGDSSLASDFIPVTANTTYIAQQWYIMNHPAGGGYLRYAFYDSTKTPISRVPAPANNNATYSKWVITTPANTSFIRMSFDYTANNGSNVKFEQGNMPTDWTPAPEDTDNKISTVSQTVDSISSIVSDPTTGLTKRVQTAEGTLSQVTGADIPALQKATYWQAPNGYDLNTYLTQGSTFFRDTTARTNAPTTSTKWMYLVVERTPNGDRVTQTAWYDTQTDAKITYRRQYAGTWGAWYANDNDSVTSISQTNGAIQTEISNRATGDTNTLTQAKDFTTSSITSSETGMKSLITQTSDSIIAKVNTKTDSATVLSLLRDNWSIGITGNTNKLASGIAADPNAMNIVSPKVIISSPQTQITGTAWIKTAMIADGQISTAKIGDASITSAKIADLDVSKITGNVSNFIQSNWNGVYESTTITNDGMKIMTSDVTTTFGPYGIKLTQGGESVGGIGVSSYVGMPANFQGIAFNLDGTGDYMTWGARASGVTTGDYATKLSWFRSSYKPSGQNAGFNFSDDSPVTFWGDIYGRENTEPLKIASFGMKGVSAGGIGHGNGSSAITFGGDGETYIISSGTYYKLAQFVKALQPLIGLGTWSAPKNINSNGVVTQWTNVTT